MRGHANLMTEEYQKLSAQFEEVTQEQHAARHTLLVKILAGEIVGWRTAAEIIQESVGKLVDDETIDPKFAAELQNKFIDGLKTTAEQMRRAINTELGIIVEGRLDGETPET
jgi:hypothetical protein